MDRHPRATDRRIPAGACAVSDRILALAVMDSIEHTTGYAPRKATVPWFVVISWSVVAIALLAAIIFGG